jgi:hypothetical protein
MPNDLISIDIHRNSNIFAQKSKWRQLPICAFSVTNASTALLCHGLVLIFHFLHRKNRFRG